MSIRCQAYFGDHIQAWQVVLICECIYYNWYDTLN